MIRTIALALLMAGMAAGPASAEVLAKSGVFNGLTVEYRVVLPDGYDPAKTYPVILDFPGGPQRIDMIDRSLARGLQPLAERLGWVVVTPAAPDGRLYFQGGEAAMPDFLAMIFSEFHVEGGKLHISGVSNGGRSAFHIAALYPDKFSSVTGYPGLNASDDPEELQKFAAMCIYMHAGSEDPGWAGAMQAEAAQYEGLGYKVKFTLEPGQRHVMDFSKDEFGERLFADLEASRRGC